MLRATDVDRAARRAALGRTGAIAILSAVIVPAWLVRLPAVADALGIDQGLLASGRRV